MTLLEGVTRGLPEEYRSPPDAADPLSAIRIRALRTMLRDLDNLGVPPEIAHRIAPKVMASLNVVLDADVDICEMVAACLVASRVMLATTVAILAEPVGPTDD